MVAVPKYQPSVQERPAFQQSITTQANAGDFGAAIGAGMGNLAQGVQQAGNAFGQLAELEDTASAKEADNQYAAWVRERSYGDGGFMTLSGKAAVDGRAAFETEAEQKRASFGEGLRPGAAQVYGQASQSRLNSVLESSIVHTAQERKTWFGEASSARVDTFADDALAAWNNPAKVDFNIAGGQAELRQMGALQGWDADTLANKEAAYISSVRKNVALRQMLDDPMKASAYIEEHRGQLSGPDQFALDEALQVPLANAQGMSAAADFMTNTTREMGAPNAGQGPTQARANLANRLVVKDRLADVDGLDGSFANNLSAMFDDAPPAMRDGLGILSGARSNERQQALFDAEVARQGGNVAAARHNVAPAGHSEHNFGTAVDLSYNGKNLKYAPPEVIKWVHDNAGKYGMTFPLDWESWHIEPLNARGGSTAVATTGVTVPRASAPSWSQMETYLAGIANPKAREVARSAITSQINAQAKDAEATTKRVTESAFSEMITQNVSPYSFPPEVQSAIGREGMSNLMSYWDKVSAGEKIETDPNLLYAMQTAYATDPAAFAAQDLLQYRTKLSDEDWKAVTGWRQTALTDQRKASEDGLALTTAFSSATTALEAAGITTTGKKDQERVDAAKQIAMFNNVLAQEMESFKQQNENRPPNPMEIQAMVNRLLLPTVVKPTNVDDGFFGNHFFGFGLPGNKDGFLFEAGNRPDNTTVDVNLTYADVPVDLRTSIRSTLETQLGRPPTEQEVADEYEQYLLGQ